MADIVKVGIAVVEGDRILLVRKRGSRTFILPGGKPERGEDDLAALSRELDEELGCGFDGESIRSLGSFTDRIQGRGNDRVTVKLYRGTLAGVPSPASEIEELRWHALSDVGDADLAPSLRNLILPFLAAEQAA